MNNLTGHKTRDTRAKTSRNSHFWQQDGQEAFVAHYVPLLIAYAQQLALSLDQNQAELLLKHLWLVLEANARINITALRDPDEALIKHVVDSLLFSHAMGQGDRPMLDLGTGAGYPGLVLALMNGNPTVLLDSVKKKITVCQKIVEQLGAPNVTCVADRAEEYALHHPREFGIVTARALASLDVLLEYAEPLLEMGGIFITSKGQLSEAEEAASDYVAELLGFELVSRETYVLPSHAGHRELLTFQKVRDSSIRLPRSIGRATKKPLSSQNSNLIKNA